MKASNFALIISKCLLGLSVCAQSKISFSDLIDQVRPSIAQIILILGDGNDATSPKMPPDLRPMFEGGTWIAGTGLLINHDGDILTAAHVALGMQQVVKRASEAGIQVRIGVAFTAPNIDWSGFKMRSDSLAVGGQILGIDPEYDIAVIRAGTNPEELGQRIQGKNTFTPPKPLKFSLAKPRNGQEVFACGFPVGSHDLVTTFGNIASAEGFEPLLTAKSNGFSSPVDVYKVDLRVSPGNSGGPLFRRSDHAVIGIIVESVKEGGYAKAVPAKEVTDSLTKHGIKWEAVPESNQQSSQRHPKSVPR